MVPGSWPHTLMMYGHYIRSLSRDIKARILEQTSANIQGVKVAAVDTDYQHYADTGPASPET